MAVKLEPTHINEFLLFIFQINKLRDIVHLDFTRCLLCVKITKQK